MSHRHPSSVSASKRSGQAYLFSAVAIVVAGIAAIIVMTLQKPKAHVNSSQGSQTVTPLTLKTGQPFPWTYRPYRLNGTPGSLLQGKRSTIVVMIASWCKFCAYDDEYVWPALARTSGVAVDIIDVSTNGGIGSPGPFSPPFQGTDHVGGTINRQGMIAVMQKYRAQFHLKASNIAVYVDPQGLKRWPIPSFPTVAFINGKGTVTQIVNYGLTLSQARAALKTALQ